MAEWIEYQARYASQEIERDRPTDLRIKVYEDGSLSAPSEGTVSVYNASNTAVVDGAAVTVSGSIATYEVLAATVTDEAYGAGWRVEWSLTMADTFVHVFREDASLVRVKIHPTVTDADLLRLHPDLNSYLPTGTNSWQSQILEAWRSITDRLEGMGRRPYLIMSPASLRPVHMAATLEIICRLCAGSGSADNRWHVQADRYRFEREEAWGRLVFNYDEQDDGQGDHTRRQAARPQLWLAGRG
jgi:hypothetical protein